MVSKSLAMYDRAWGKGGELEEPGQGAKISEAGETEMRSRGEGVLEGMGG